MAINVVRVHTHTHTHTDSLIEYKNNRKHKTISLCVFL